MRQKINNFFIGGHNFKQEFKRQLRLLITFTLGFTIAFTWRQTIFDTTQSIVNFFANFESTTTQSIVTSIIITLVSLIVIWLAAKFICQDTSTFPVSWSCSRIKEYQDSWHKITTILTNHGSKNNQKNTKKTKDFPYKKKVQNRVQKTNPLSNHSSNRIHSSFLLAQCSIQLIPTNSQ